MRYRAARGRGGSARGERLTTLGYPATPDDLAFRFDDREDTARRASGRVFPIIEAEGEIVGCCRITQRRKAFAPRATTASACGPVSHRASLAVLSLFNPPIRRGIPPATTHGF